MDIQKLNKQAKIIRRHVIEMICSAGCGHPGGSLSAADIITALYFYKMRYDAKNPSWEARDRFVLSKGHAAPALYAALAEVGFIPIKYLTTLRQIGSSLQGHPDMLSLPGIDMTTGSLGQGLSAANGMALASRIDKLDYKVYCLIGDGESQEGQIWEAAMTAGHHRLANVIAIVDHNNLQIDGKVEAIKGVEPLADKWRAFRWNVIEVDGHDMAALCAALDKAAGNTDGPTVLIANTVKGKGVSFMEHNVGFHGKAPNAEEAAKAREELTCD